MFGRRKIAALVAEFLGTGVLTLLILSVQRSPIGYPLFVSAAAGVTFAFLVFVFYRVSGSHFNPALTFGLWTARRVTTIRAVGYIVAQVAGAFLAYYLYKYLVNTELQKLDSKFDWRIFTAEAVGAGLFALGYAAAVYQRFLIGAAAAVAGLAYMLGSLAASPASVGLINPAIAFGVKASTLAYIIAPFVGAIIGVNLYNLLFAAPRGAVVGDTLNGGDVTEALKATAVAEKAEVVQTTVTTVKPVRKAKATTAKTRSTAGRSTAKKRTTTRKKS